MERIHQRRLNGLGRDCRAHPLAQLWLGMLPLLMFFKGREIIVSARTFLTLELVLLPIIRPISYFSYVCGLVLRQITATREFLTALITFKGLFSRVNPAVSNKVRNLHISRNTLLS